MSKRQTAIEWLLNELIRVGYFQDMIPKITFEQAKAMEKEQIMDAFNDGEHQQGFECEAEQYYKETYES